MCTSRFILIMLHDEEEKIKNNKIYCMTLHIFIRIPINIYNNIKYSNKEKKNN